MASTGKSSSLRWMIGLVAVCLASMLLSPTRVHAQVPRLVGYQGYLATSGGVAVNATLQMTFKLYDGPSGAQVWSETQTVPVVNGVYSVQLGSVASLPANFSVPYWLGVTVGIADPEMTPRQALLASPYSLYATGAGCTPGDMISCYTGVLSTLNIGPCKAGVRLCSPPGIAFGSCSGEIVPAASDTCGNAIDDNCNGAVDDGCDLSNGSACTLNAQCASGSCVDGVCCNSACNGTCQACSASKTGGSNGTCANIPVLADPDNECGPYFCSGTGTCSATCPTSEYCKQPNYVCGALNTCDVKAALGTICTISFDCMSGFCASGRCCSSACVGGTCDQTGTCTGSAQGSPCANGANCYSGFCVSNVCCDSACPGGTCTAGTGGVCTP